ncbi:MAG: SDR family NAD(P)-dependent oxidoreductase [Candidatus Jordarchaeum sp.]|uniref:SDR family NAD(P)-dependent oxidoreductase n=1 Tax=Candidatus Jordarchaeum sp. TaxID=2823881 RepID=UPI00404AD97D
MKVKGEKVLVTGGAGFIGSHLVDRLVDLSCDVIVLDNLSNTTTEYIQDHIDRGRIEFVKGDVRDFETVESCLDDISLVFHFAAQYDVRRSVSDPVYDFDINVNGMINILEAMRKNDVLNIVFASSGGTLYGLADAIPTPETYPPQPISPYGASKAASEMYISAYCACYGLCGVSLRYANIIGPRSLHGVIFDFYQKLKKEPKSLEILGDGKQKKSYMDVSDCVSASLHITEKIERGFNIFNIGSEEWVTVNYIAKLVINQLKLTNVELSYTGGEQGWIGDVPLMLLSISKLKDLGWKPTMRIDAAIRRYVKWLVEKYGSL